MREGSTALVVLLVMDVDPDPEAAALGGPTFGTAPGCAGGCIPWLGGTDRRVACGAPEGNRAVCRAVMCARERESGVHVSGRML